MGSTVSSVLIALPFLAGIIVSLVSYSVFRKSSGRIKVLLGGTFLFNLIGLVLLFYPV